MTGGNPRQVLQSSVDLSRDGAAGGSVRFSECNLWQEQRRFYLEKGIQAWRSKVPYQVTCNPVIANAYAHLIVRFLQDRSRHVPVPSQPVVILELGSGPGLFGFYVVTRLLELREALELREPRFVYVMSDFSAETIAFWRAHPALSSLVGQGALDFAQYDIGASGDVRLLESGVVLGRGGAEESGGAPLIVLANYVFDTLPQDVFRVAEGRLLEGHTKGLLEGVVLPALDNVPLSLSHLGVDLEFREAALPYYGDPFFDRVLQGYMEALAEESFLFPLHALLGLRDLAEIAGGHLLLIATDKALSHVPPGLSAETPDLALHDASFSLMVNFHALGEYVLARGGSVVHQPAVQPISTSVFYLGGSLDRLPETKTAISTFLLDFSPGDLSTLFGQVGTVLPGCLLALLSLSQWDPAYVNNSIDQIVALVKEADPETRRCLTDGMRWCAEQSYALPGADATLANVGIFFQELKDYPTALDYFHRSIEILGSEPRDRYANTLYNMGLCHFHLGEREAALEAFRRADAAAPNKDMMAKGWIYHLTVEEAPRPQESTAPAESLRV